jgi:hypothetical protein
VAQHPADSRIELVERSSDPQAKILATSFRLFGVLCAESAGDRLGSLQSRKAHSDLRLATGLLSDGILANAECAAPTYQLHS